ncbi:leucyl/phenylalanyl-tRNA--protein transferase [Shewanella sp. OPT22]|nr:leucyl/phenylalanyl-tRNA--protein transferase [Shewanella sp. OPT22]
MHSLTFLTESDHSFPDPSLALAEPNGLLAIGGDLSPTRLLAAYQSGIFPWFDDQDPILWWSPDPRAMVIPGQLHISKSLKKLLKKSDWTITINHDFKSVIQHCAKPRLKQEATWITQDIQDAYCQLHNLGQAHSIEVWAQGQLIGGLYGIAVGRVFCGESMFHIKTNASKVAMVYLQELLLEFDYALIDTQMMNPHLESLGAKIISRNDFLTLLAEFKQQQPKQGCWQARVFREGGIHE